MKWSEFYEKADNCEVSTVVKMIPSLEEFGSPKEIADVILIIGSEDKKGANSLLNKALDKGIKFNADELSDIFGSCDRENFDKALYSSADRFTDEDIENLYYIIEEDVVVKLAKKYGLKLPEDIASEYEEEMISDTTPVSWEQFYNGMFEWNEGYSKRRSRVLTDYGNEEDIITVLYQLFDGDINGADNFIKEAVNHGVTFSGNNLSEISYFCSGSVFRYALNKSSKRFTDKDLEDVSDDLNDDEVIKLAEELHLNLPEGYEIYDENDDIDEINNIAELQAVILDAIELADEALKALNDAGAAVNEGSRTSLFDILSKSFYSSATKNLALEEADFQIQTAEESISQLNDILKGISKCRYIKMNSEKLASLLDMYTNDSFINMITHMKIGKMGKNINKTTKDVINTRHKLEKIYKKLCRAV